MSRDYNVLLLDMMWSYSRDSFVSLKTTSGTIISIEDFGYKSEYTTALDYEDVLVNDGNVAAKGGVKFFENIFAYKKWHKENPLTAKLLVLAISPDKSLENSIPPNFHMVVFEIPEILIKRYFSLSYSNDYCCDLLASYDSFKFQGLMTRLVIERLEQKEQLLREKYDLFDGNMNELMLYSIFDSFLIGTKNRETMRELFYAIKGGSVMSFFTADIHFEALLLGASGLLDTMTVSDQHFAELRKIFYDISKKFSIRPINSSRWSYSSSSPRQTLWILISHLASVLAFHRDLLFKIIDVRSYNDIVEIFNVPLPQYWQSLNHPQREESSKNSSPQFPRGRRSAMIINGIIPFMFFYFRNKDNTLFEEYAETILDILMATEKENHRYTRMWTTGGVQNENAFESQGLTQLGKCYCTEKICPQCPIGVAQLLKMLTHNQE